ncbi:MAG: hypothetical protein JOY60_08320 [Burkholderiaceae bacterium]|nr:hypothetical protein [Burkholderiaceae bacterium]
MNTASTLLGRPLQRAFGLNSAFAAIGARLWKRILSNAKLLVLTAAKMQERSW